MVFGLGWYIVWPFGKYVKGDSEDGDDEENQLEENGNTNVASQSATLSVTQLYAVASTHTECTSLRSKSYVAAPTSINTYRSVSEDWLGRTVFWIVFCVVIAPLIFLTCIKFVGTG